MNNRSRRAIGGLLGAVMMLFAGAGAGALAQDGKPLKIGIDGRYPPFSEVKSGKPVGFDVEIAQALCEQMNAKCQLIQVNSWSEVIPAVESGRFDAVVASMSVTRERLKRIDFTDKYYHVAARFVGKRALASASPADLAGKRVGVQAATTHASFLSSKFGSAMQVKTYDTLTAALDDLKKGKLDLVMGDSLALNYGLLTAKGGKDYAFVGPAYTDPTWFGKGNAIALAKDQQALKQRFNAAIQAIRTSGKYQEIAERYFAFDIYGGDS